MREFIYNELKKGQSNSYYIEAFCHGMESRGLSHQNCSGQQLSLTRILGDYLDKAPDEIDEEFFTVRFAEFRDKWSKAYYNYQLCILKNYYKFLKANKIIQELPPRLVNIKRVKVVPPANNLVSEDIEKVKVTLEGDLNKNLILMAIELGLSTSEIKSIRRDNIDYEKGLVYIQKCHTHRTAIEAKKFMINFPVALTEASSSILRDQEQKSQSLYIFTETEGVLVTDEQIYSSFKMIKDATGIDGVNMSALKRYCLANRGCNEVN